MDANSLAFRSTLLSFLLANLIKFNLNFKENQGITEFIIKSSGAMTAQSS